jgi:hypothetical protein
MPWAKVGNSLCFNNPIKWDGRPHYCYFGTGEPARLSAKWFSETKVERMLTTQQFKRKVAQTHFDTAKDIDAEIAKYIKDIRDTALNALIETLITKDQFEHEAYFRRTLRVAEQLAGPNPTSLIKLWARLVAEAHLELGAIDTQMFLGLEEAGWLKVAGIRAHRNHCAKRVSTFSKTLATIRRIDVSVIDDIVLKVA